MPLNICPGPSQYNLIKKHLLTFAHSAQDNFTQNDTFIFITLQSLFPNQIYVLGKERDIKTQISSFDSGLFPCSGQESFADPLNPDIFPVFNVNVVSPHSRLQSSQQGVLVIQQPGWVIRPVCPSSLPIQL